MFWAAPRPVPFVGPLLLAGFLLITPLAADANRPPNFVLILVDNLGYGDVGCFGSTKHRTPNIDRLASEGARLTSFYSAAPVCTPSR
ncbi:MAG: sulfatase-like hydrolase/transferase, partial [Pirellulaceae bacterium]|nr:sulfatase-like hydrolase/transferase [Pirellulaceae bacterium]